MAKDVTLYLEATLSEGAPATIGQVTADIWQQFADADPDVDFTRIYEFAKQR